jgi:hypothetical protein
MMWECRSEDVCAMKKSQKRRELKKSSRRRDKKRAVSKREGRNCPATSPYRRPLPQP